MTIKVEDAIANLKYQMLRFAKGTEPDLALQMAVKALEQKAKSEWEHDYEILKAHSEGAREILDIIRAEVVELQKDYQEYGWAYDDVIEIIDKYNEGAEEADAEKLQSDS